MSTKRDIIAAENAERQKANLKRGKESPVTPKLGERSSGSKTRKSERWWLWPVCGMVALAVYAAWLGAA